MVRLTYLLESVNGPFGAHLLKATKNNAPRKPVVMHLLHVGLRYCVISGNPFSGSSAQKLDISKIRKNAQSCHCFQKHVWVLTQSLLNIWCYLVLFKNVNISCFTETEERVPQAGLMFTPEQIRQFPRVQCYACFLPPWDAGLT